MLARLGTAVVVVRAVLSTSTLVGTNGSYWHFTSAYPFANRCL